MCVESAYYDACIFLAAVNKQHPEQEACQRLVNPREIDWVVHVCPELAAAEATVAEYIEQFEIGCTSQGVEVRALPASEIGPVAKRHSALKKALGKYGFQGRDWRHLMAAVAGEAAVLVTVDPDFWDPQNKAQRKSKKRQERVKKEIETALELEIRLPSELEGACC